MKNTLRRLMAMAMTVMLLISNMPVSALANTVNDVSPVNQAARVAVGQPSVEITDETLTMNAGDEYQLTATVTMIEDKTVWTTSDATVATVDENGKVTAIGVGAAVITATAGSLADTVAVQVSATVTLDMTKVGGEREKLPIDAPKTVGELTAGKGEGISWKIGEYFASAEDRITGNVTLVAVATRVVEELTLAPTTLELNVNETKQVIATVKPDDAVDKEITWTSDNPEFAVVDPKEGTVTGVSAGTAWITASVGNVSERIPVTVNAPDGTTDVYVYLHIIFEEGFSSDGWTLNPQGWYTIGKITVPAKLLNDFHLENLGIGTEIHNYPPELLSYLPSIELHEINEKVANGIKLTDDAITWPYLKAENGADNYLNGGASDNPVRCWHLDGELRVKAKKSTLTIKYVYSDGKPVAKDYVTTVANGTSVPAVASPTAGRDGYSPDQAVVGPIVVMGDRTIFVTYFANNHTVRYSWSGLPNRQLYNESGEKVEADTLLPEIQPYETGDTYTVDATAYPTLFVHDAKGNVAASYTFAGWQHEPGSHEMPNRNVTIYGDWVKASSSYTVRYLEQGTDNNELYAQKNGPATIIGNTVTEKAIDVPGYTPVAPTEQKITIRESGNEITFYYTKRADLSYTVNHVDKDTNAVLSTETVENVTFGTEITSESHKKDIEGYTFDSADKETLTIGTDTAANVINLYYTKQTNLSYTVNHVDKDTNAVLSTETVKNVTFGTEITSESHKKDIEGYNYDSADKETLTIGADTAANVINLYYTKRAGLSYTVNYLDKDTNVVLSTETVENVTFGTEITSESHKKDIAGYNYDSADKETITVGLNAEENVINLYYTKRTDMSYTVNYYWNNSTDKIAESVTVGPKTLGDKETVQPAEFDGYVLVAEPDTDPAQTITISAEEAENVVNFYYYKAVTVTVDDKTKTFGQADPELTATVTGLMAREAFTPQYTLAIEGEHELVGVYTNAITDKNFQKVQGDGKYLVTFNAGTLTVTGEPIVPAKTTPAVERGYALGAEIPFTITVRNVTTEPLTNITVTDPTAAIVAGDGYTVRNGEAVIATLDSGSTVSVQARHTVTERDVLAGTYVNTATVRVNDRSYDVTANARIVDPNPHLTVAKTVTSQSANPNGYRLGETIRYQITVTNDGNLTVNDIDVTDSLSTAAGNVIGHIDTLAPGAVSQPFTFEYVVTAADLTAGRVRNTATAIATNPDPDPDSPENLPVTPGVTESSVVNEYRLTINYWYNRAGGRTAADSYVGVYRYGQGYNVASPRVTGYAPDLGSVVGTITADTTVDVIYTRNSYTLTIQYRYTDGTAAAPTYLARNVPYGDTYSIASPTVPGYETTTPLVAGTMPDSDLTFTVFYARDARETFVEIDEFGVPLGLGGIVMNVGDCFE